MYTYAPCYTTTTTGNDIQSNVLFISPSVRAVELFSFFLSP